MGMFEKNMETFKLHKGRFYNLLTEYQNRKDKELSLDKIETLQARDGSNILSVVKDGQTFRLNSMYRPQAEAEKWCEQYEFNNLRMNILMFGIGNGIFVRKMLEQVSSDAMVYLYEPCVEIFLHALSEEDFTEIIADPRILFYFGGLNEKELYFDLSGRTHWSNLLTQLDCCHPGYKKVFPKEYNQFCDWITECDTIEVINKNTGVFFAESLTRNALYNLSFVLESNQIEEYIGKFEEDTPAIIVAAGPSLDKNIEELRRAEGKAFIMAVDTAVRRMVKENIRFDCMVSVDPKKPARYMKLPECKDVPLFCGLESNFRIMDYHEGKKIWFRDSGYYLTKLYEKYRKKFVMPATGGSVATAALSICAALQFRKIILVGQDLAYDGEITHAGGEISGIKNEKMTTCMVEGINGGMVKSRGDWKMYLEWFEKNIERLKDETEVIDATEGGALIHGTTIMTLREAVDAYCKKEADISKIILDQKPTFVSKREEIKKELCHIEKEFRGIADKAKQAVDNVNKALEIIEQNPESLEIDKYTKEIVKANNFVGKQRVYEILDQYIEEEAIKAMEKINVMSGDEWEDRRLTLVSAGKLYQTMVDAIQEMQPMIEEAIERIKAQ